MRCPSEYKPPISRLATSLQLRRKEYLRETNLHAISYFVDPSQPKFERSSCHHVQNVPSVCQNTFEENVWMCVCVSVMASQNSNVYNPRTVLTTALKICRHVQLYNTFTDYNIRHDSSCGSNVMSFSNSPKKNVITQAIANFVILI
ncbi:uncharacterized protein LOC107265208 isoform X1 [Cephus cinctus]|uniref:Uncharacterized protein LOC107265208 isoform X1 n=1 Tax=Cephus cinctus TaxID=211228 RepID=A0AAJ7FFY7_CEPCN|nr:uncharacterized protein LOC107265208 isoform X1 [Cephus cinctus]